MPIVGRVVGDRYRLVESIASGGMGDVWRAVDETLDRCVAVKMLQPRLVTDPGFGERFRREARAMAALRHPGVAQVYDYGEVSGPDAPVLAYIVMECVQGQPLSERIAEVGRLGVAETMSIAAQTAGALQAAHDAGVVHRDVKPSNLIIEPDGHVVLVDFGVAVTQEAASLTGTNQVVGTALYMAPEQVTRNETTPAIDIYALGAVVYHCLAGRPPHQGENAVAVALRHLQDEPPPLPEDVPEAVRRLVATALAKEPTRRFPTAAAMATAAQALADSSDQLLRTAVAVPIGAPAERTEVQRPVVGSAAKRSGGPGPKVLAALVGSLAAAAAVLVFADPTGIMPGRTGQPSTPPSVSPTVPSQRDPGPGAGGGDPNSRGSAGLPVRATGSATTTPTPGGPAGAGTDGQSPSPGESTGGGPEPTSSESAPTDPTTAPTGGATPTQPSSEDPEDEPEDEPVANPTKKPSAEEPAAQTSSARQL
ncbi:serine/threonine-protein kinase [Micromonospora chokoriensis]|uniref:non-specific serine/threonine protein kinase n=1 Tax=Micromonospora chokoriensis TaxID=356851 RepID=A0A1C4YLA5_9ACTN|nr:serine/threonine-protein kinase [Micromonospora chokoriensis]SCF21426.1 serine/threonine protein kinase [Micromonospora chokoriensis]